MRICFIAFLILINTFLSAQINKEVNSNIESVIVYLSGATISRTAQTTIPKGESKIVLKNLSDNINENSIVAKVIGNGALLSVSYNLNYLVSENRDQTIKKYRDSLEMIQLEQGVLEYQQSVYKKEQSSLLVNNNLSNEQTGIDVERLKSLLSYQRKQNLELSKIIFDLDQKIKSSKEKTKKYRAQISTLNGSTKRPTGDIILTVFAKSTQKVKIEVEYLIGNAGWKPVYDLRVNDISKPVDLAFKAQVHQNSGVNWDKVNLSISTGNPAINQNLPVLNKLNVESFDNYQYKRKKKLFSPSKNHQMYGFNGSKSSYKHTREKISEEVEESEDVSYQVTAKQNQITTAYNINIPQSIKTDNLDYLVNVSNYDLPASFHYFATPKISKNAYLLAEVTEWGKYNLLEAEASIFFEGAYVGKTFINPNTADDTLAISMGIDKNVQITRNENTEKSGKKLLGLKRKIDYIYDFSALNNKHVEVDLEVVDQIPVASQDEVEVKLEQADQGKLNPDNGELVWKMKLKPSESKKWSSHYSIKYPKGKSIKGTK